MENSKELDGDFIFVENSFHASEWNDGADPSASQDATVAILHEDEPTAEIPISLRWCQKGTGEFAQRGRFKTCVLLQESTMA